MNNTPTLMQSEEERAPWNKSNKLINITVSQMLSAEVSILVPEDFDLDNEDALKDAVREQIMLPHEVINENSTDFWAVDDFCVMV